MNEAPAADATVTFRATILLAGRTATGIRAETRQRRIAKTVAALPEERT